MPRSTYSRSGNLRAGSIVRTVIPENSYTISHKIIVARAKAKFIEAMPLDEQFRRFVLRKKSYETWKQRLTLWLQVNRDKPYIDEARRLAKAYWHNKVLTAGSR